MSRFLELVRSRPVIYDGSMGATILNMQLTIEDYGGKEGCNDYLVISKPSVIEEIHASYLEAGADVLETDTFGGNLIKMEEYGLGELTYELNRKAAELARRVADEYSTPGQPRFVAGSIGPTGLLPASEDPMLGQHRFQQVVDLFIDQIRGLVDGGADVLIIETVQDILELKAAIHAAIRVREETGVYVPMQASITLDTSGRMLLGTDIAAALNILEHLPVDIIGLNCSTGPDYMREPARYLGEYSTRPVSIIPNAGIPINVNGLAVFPMEPEPMARGLREMVEEFEVGIVGGCCGTTPEHIIEMSREIKTRPVTARPIKRLAQVASMIRAVDLQQNPAPIIVGERLNTLGSRKVKRLVLADDLDGIMSVATSQMEEGAHALDVCVALTERADERDTMRKLVKKLALKVEAPLVIDSTEADVVQDALEQYPGRAIVNSINMENGRGKIESVMPHGDGPWRRRHCPDDRRRGHGQNPRAQAGGRQSHPRDRHRGIRARSRESDLRRADLHADDRRSGIQELGDRDDRRHPPDRSGAPRRTDRARRLERLVRHQSRRPQDHQRGLPLSLRSRPDSISRSSTRRMSCRSPRFRPKSVSWPRT